MFFWSAFLKTHFKKKLLLLPVLKISNPRKSTFSSFEIKTFKKIFFKLFFCFSFKTIDAQMLFRSVGIFENTQKKLLTAKSGQNSEFDS